MGLPQRVFFKAVFSSCLLVLGSCAPSCSPVSDTQILVNYDVNEIPPCDLFYVQLASPGNEAQPFGLVTTTNFPVNISGLNPELTYSVSIRGHNASTPSISWGPSWFGPSEWIRCTTINVPNSKTTKKTTTSIQAEDYSKSLSSSLKKAGDSAGSQFIQVYRISEYSFDVDFLANHDGASSGAMPLYLMTCSPDGTCTPWSVTDYTSRWDSCQETLQQLCPDQRGASFDCLDCMTLNRDAVTGACGNWSKQDTTQGEGSFSVHWYCGVGWPESTPTEGPITEYCVEYLPLGDAGEEGKEGKEGFSDYLSCNSDEVDGLVGNDPRDPSCICICFDDRLLSHQSPSQLQRDCAFLTNDDYMPWVNETSCNCANTSSPLPQANLSSASSLTNIGRTPIYLPYVGIPLLPTGLREYDELIGFNYHFPKDTECASSQELGNQGCTWKRLPISRMIYGDNLIANGWDLNFVKDTPTNTSHTKANIDAFSKSFQSLDGMFLSSSPCR